MLKPYFYWAGICASLFLTPAAYGDTASPALSRWANTIINSSPQVQAERAALDAAQANARVAKQPLFNPELELDFERTDISTKTASISQTLDWSNKRGAQMTVAAFSVQAAIANLALTRQERASELLSKLSAFHAMNRPHFTRHKSVSLCNAVHTLPEIADY